MGLRTAPGQRLGPISGSCGTCLTRVAMLRSVCPRCPVMGWVPRYGHARDHVEGCCCKG